MEHTVWAWGGESCGSWTAAAERGLSYPKRTIFKGWLTGYVTAMNLWRVSQGHPDFETDAEGMVAWVDNYCKAHPLDLVADAAMYLSFELAAVPVKPSS